MTNPQYWKHAIGAFFVVACFFLSVKLALWYGSQKDRTSQMNIEYEIRQMNEDSPLSEDFDNYVINEYEIGGDWLEDSNITILDSDWTVPEEGNLTFFEEYFNKSDVKKNHWDKYLENAFDFTMHIAKYLNSTIQDRNLTVSELRNLTLNEEYFDNSENNTDFDKSFIKNAYKFRVYFAKIFNLTIQDGNLTIPEDYFDYSDENNKDLDNNLKNAHELREYFAKMFNLTIQDGNFTVPKGSNSTNPEDYLDYSDEKNKDLDNYLKFRKLKRRRRVVDNWLSRALKRGQRQKVRRMKH